MADPIFHVDAFTGVAFGGNPAAVCILSRAREDSWLAAVAREMNLAETAFLEPTGPAWRLRWFTPSVEVDLCGHATLASAHILWETGRARPEATLHFHTRSGQLAASRQGDSIELDFPAETASAQEISRELKEALGLTAVGFTGKNRFDYLIEVPDEAAVRAIAPDFRRLRTAGEGARGVIVTALSRDGTHDFVSRFFAPAAGIDEDPVTGSAHCCLGPYWAERLGKQTVSGYQASARGGTVTVRIALPRVFLGGRAVTIVRGEIL